jgi:hypothetical protein
MNFTRFFLASVAALLLVGCAHPIKVTPDLTKMVRAENAPARVAANIAYYIPAELLAIEVTTPGGGGDNVRYFPYQELEAGFQKILSNNFSGVVKLSSSPDLPRLAQDGITYTIAPEVITTSGGSGFFTWPPTNFTVDLTSNIRDTSGKVIAKPRVVGTGSAETGERIREHGIAGRRAMEDALLKMQTALQETNFYSNVPKISTTTQISAPTSNAAGTRLAHIKELKEKNLISQEEYEAKRKEILGAL